MLGFLKIGGGRTLGNPRDIKVFLYFNLPKLLSCRVLPTKK